MDFKFNALDGKGRLSACHNDQPWLPRSLLNGHWQALNLLIIKVVLFTVSGPLEKAGQGEQPARAARSQHYL